MNKIKINSVIYILISLMIILECNTLYTYIVGSRYITSSLAIILSVVVLFLKKIKKNVVDFMVYYIISVIILLLFSDFRSIAFGSGVVIPFLCFNVIFSKVGASENILEYFTNIMILVSVVSLFFFFCGSLLDIIHPTGYYSCAQIGWGGRVGGVNYKDYYHLYFQGTMVNFLGHSVVRNTAIFVEGPMFTYPLSIAIYYEWNLRKEGTRKKLLVVMIVAMLTAFTTTGYLAILIIFIFHILESERSKKHIKWLIFIVSVIAVFFISLKLISDKFINGSISTAKRIDDVLACIKAFIHNPLVGIGYNNIRGLDIYRNVYRNEAGLSTGFFGLLAFGGIVLSIWYILPLVIGFFKLIKDRKFLRYYGFIVLIFFLLCITVVQFTILNTMLISLSWMLCLRKESYDNMT